MKNDKKNPFFSIVIPTLDEESYLPLLLSDLSLQTFDDFEIIHVDGGSQDKTLEKAKQWRDKINLRTFSHDQRSVAAERNRGASESNGDWIIFMDADDRLPNSFLADVKRQINLNDGNPRKRFDIFTTLVRLNHADRKSFQKRMVINSINFFLKNTSKTKRPIALGAMLGIRREVFGRVRFDEKNKVSEDSIFVKHGIMSGWKYTVLITPTYFYSMRRVSSNGAYHTIITGFMMNFRYLIGDNFNKNDYGYKMLGGSIYKDKKRKS